MSNLTAKDLFGSMTALATPMSANGKINYAQWEELIQVQIVAGINSIVVAGTTGESVMLDSEEIKQLVKIAITCSKGSKIKVIVGTGHVCAEKVIQNNEIAHQMGADAVLVVTPYYIRTTQAGLQKHYLTIADQSALPIILYNVPTRTQNDLLPQTAAKLAQHSQIIGIKEAVSENDRIKELIKKCPINFAILSGDDDSFCDSIKNGAHGVISVASNIRPLVVTKICNYLALGDVISAKKLNSSLDNLYKMLSCQPNPIPVKYLMHKAGLIDNGIRLPLLWMDKVWMDKNMTGSESEITEIKQIIKEYKI